MSSYSRAFFYFTRCSGNSMVAAEFAAIRPLLSLKSYHNAPAAAIIPVLVLIMQTTKN